MTLKLNQYQQLVWRTPFEAQVGLSKNRVTLSELSLEEEKFIDALYLGIAPNQVDAVAKQSRVAVERAKKLIEQLEPLMLQRIAEPHSQVNLLDVDRAMAEIVRASLNHGSDGELILIERSKRSVFVETLDSTGLLLVNALAAAGVGTIITSDSSAVLNRDIGASGYPVALLGKKRVTAIQLMLHASHSTLRLVPPNRIRHKNLARVDLAFFTAQQIFDPRQYSRWATSTSAQFGINFNAMGAWLSGVIRLGETPCICCHDIGARERDASFQAVGLQLISSALRFDDEATKLLAVGIAAQEILNELDAVAGFAKRTAHRGFVVDRDAGLVSETSWLRQNSCSCTMLEEQLAEQVA
ncbi:MAG: hypothetical protein ACKOWE_05920 [Micrococcales bacterium]